MMDMIWSAFEPRLQTILQDQYNKGFEAGVMAQKMKEKEDHNRQLTEMYNYGKEAGYNDAIAEVGEITLDDLEAIE